MDGASEVVAELWRAWYEIVLECMAGEGSARPTFASLHASLSALLEGQGTALAAPRDIGILVLQDAEHRRTQKSA